MSGDVAVNLKLDGFGFEGLDVTESERISITLSFTFSSDSDLLARAWQCFPSVPGIDKRGLLETPRAFSVVHYSARNVLGYTFFLGKASSDLLKAEASRCQLDAVLTLAEALDLCRRFTSVDKKVCFQNSLDLALEFTRPTPPPFVTRSSFAGLLFGSTSDPAPAAAAAAKEKEFGGPW